MKQQKYDGNHPMQPLCPRKQPWLSSQTIGSRPAAMARSFSNPHIAPQLSVEDLLLLRQRIADRASIKLEKLHSAVDTRRHDRVILVFFLHLSYLLCFSIFGLVECRRSF